MNGPLKCPQHNLPQEIICLGQFCNKRIGCQLCISKHDHKFYLDTRCKQKNVTKVQQEIQAKLNHLKQYTQTNIKSLKLGIYRDKIAKQFEEERLYLANKLQQERTNFEMLMEKLTSTVSKSLSKFQEEIMRSWNSYNSEAQRHLDSQKQYNQLIGYFKEGDWTGHTHIDQTVSFLYSQELLFRFNRNLDKLKKEINHYKKENEGVLSWFYKIRNQYHKYQLCPRTAFNELVDRYSKEPQIMIYKKEYSKQSRDDQKSVIEAISSETKSLMLYPKIIYQPFQNIDKLIRYNNNVFATSGGRSLSIWTRVSMQPEKSYTLDFPSYGLSTFREYGQQDPQIIIYGKSNGQIGLINVEKETVREMDAHEGTVKDIIQVDEHHFLTASYDWSIRLWGLNSEPTQKNFASQRLLLKGSSGKVHCLCKFGPSILSAGADNTIRLWDVMHGSFDETFTHEKEVHALAQIRPEFFASGGQLKELRVWDYRKTKVPFIRFPIQFSIQSMLRYDDNTVIFNDKNIVKVIDFRNYKEPLLRLQSNSVYSHSINSMVYLSDVEIGMGGSDAFITLWKY